MEAKKRIWFILGGIAATLLFFNSIVSLIAISVNAKRADGVERDLGKLRTSVDNLASAYSRFDDSLAGLGTTLGKTERGVQAVAGRIGGLEVRVNGLAGGIADVTRSVRTAIEAVGGVQGAADGLVEENRRFAEVLRRLQEKYGSSNIGDQGK